MSDAPHRIYTQRADTTAETELNALARVYHLVLFESNARKQAAEQTPSPKPDGRDIRAKRRRNEATKERRKDANAEPQL